MDNPRGEFHHRIDTALQNEALQSALDKNAYRRKQARVESFTSLTDDLDVLRNKAHEIRSNVIEHLDEFLDRFVKRASENGFIVHYAKTDEEASQIVGGIARACNAELIVKAKSMVSEEIHLNRILENMGFKVVESDLGEYIVQLRGEPPSHIITPAVHLRRQDVARLFHEKFGMPLTDDVREMNDVARHQLRQIFLSADIGISGVNFGVVDTGSICILTNEGNGRMVTTLPRIHIALMGIERLVPSLDELASMIELLPRHATGQKITSYVNLVQSPRQPGDQDGPEERHLILVDNRRKFIANSNMKEMLLCIRCGACLNVCPVFQEIGGHAYQSPYPGPIGAILSPQLFGIAEYGHLAKASSLCGACMDVCPVEIDFPGLLLATRHQYKQEVRQPMMIDMSMKVFAQVAKRPKLYTTALKTAGILSNMLPSGENWLRTLPPPLNRWTNSRHFPKPASRPFREIWKMHASPNPPGKPHELSKEKKINAQPKHPFDGKVKGTSLIDKFTNELQLIGGKFIYCNPSNLHQQLFGVLEQSNANTILLWDDFPNLPASEIQKFVKAEGFTILSTHLMLREPTRSEGTAWISKADTGITGAFAAIADTATIVLASGKFQSQLASLLPSHHIVILPLENLYPDLRSWLKSGGTELISSQQCVTLVSGPSRTADIEMTLTIGVHGPAKITVLGVDQNSIPVSSHKPK